MVALRQCTVTGVLCELCKARLAVCGMHAVEFVAAAGVAMDEAAWAACIALLCRGVVREV